MNSYVTHWTRYGYAFKLHPLCKQAIAEISMAGMGDPQLADQNGVLWVEDGAGNPVGFLAYSWDEEAEEIWIELSFILPEYRRKGIYTALFERLVQIANRKGASSVRSGIHPNNEPMLKAAVSTGRELAPSYDGEYVTAVL